MILLLVGCVSARMAAIEARLASVEADLARIQGEPGMSPDREASAAVVLADATAAWDAGDVPKATALFSRLHADFAGTTADARSARYRDELAVIGAPAVPLPTDWIAGSTAYDAAPVTLVVMFESWCPHCQREVPALQARSAALEAKGVQIVGVTRLTRDTTVDQMRAFLHDHGVRFPIAREDGALSKALAVTGIPAAAMIRDGRVIWRGHPARLDDAVLDRVLASPAP